MNRIRISSSIANFHERLRARYSDYEDFKWFSKDPTIFFGCYHIFDYLRVFLHRGKRVVFWCGGDARQVPKFVASLLKGGEHVCENAGEQKELASVGITARIQPMLFDDPNKYQVCYEHSSEPKVWITTHEGRDNEYGVERALKVCEEAGINLAIYYGGVDRDTFDEQTSHMQGTLRFNERDGFSENLSKAMLRGQYAWSVIPYPDIETITDDDTLVAQLKELKNKHQPHESTYWREQLSKRVEV